MPRHRPVSERREAIFAAMREIQRRRNDKKIDTAARSWNRRIGWARQNARDDAIRASGPQIPLACEALEEYARLFSEVETRDSWAAERLEAIQGSGLTFSQRMELAQLQPRTAFYWWGRR